MTDKEKQYLQKRLEELSCKKISLSVEIRKVDREIVAITKKLDKEIITDE